MVDLDVLKAHGTTADAIRKFFSIDDNEVVKKDRQRWEEKISG
jgi:hypothetical protein